MPSQDELTNAITTLSKLKALRIYDKKSTLFWNNFLIGIAQGLGTVFAISILIGVIIYVLAQLQWVPLVGNFIAKVVVYLETVYGNRML